MTKVVESIGELEEELSLGEAFLAAARDPDVSVTSANPNQVVYSPGGNSDERNLANPMCGF